MTDNKQLAKNLRKPEGVEGIKVGEFMNKGNAHTYARMKKHLRLSPALKVLEIGFGNGITSRDIISQCDYTGLDYSSLMVQEAQKNCGDLKAKFVEGDIHQMPFEDESFDLIFTINTIYFWDNAEKAIAELRRVLKTGGKLLIGMRTKEDMEFLGNITQYNFKIRPLYLVEEMLVEGGFSECTYTVYLDPIVDRPDGRFVQLHSVIFEVH